MVQDQKKGKSRKKTVRKSIDEMTPEERKRYAMHRKAHRIMVLKNIRNVLVVLIVVTALAGSIAAFIISCVNDILAVHVSEKNNQDVTVVIGENMGTDEVIDTLVDSGVLRNGWFCKLAAKFFDYSDEGYIPGTYTLRRSMGMENMLNTIKAFDTARTAIVTLTFPEGYDVDQILDMLDREQVCSEDKMLQALNSQNYNDDYNFLRDRRDLTSRHTFLDGYLYPDTYEFYVGESADSVVEKFLTNFGSHWTDDYRGAAKNRKLSIDEVVILASIVQKEARPEEMEAVAGILLNRLDAGMRLDCDSTRDYAKYLATGLTENEANEIAANYDTYTCSALPAGPICEPGDEAIRAVLYAPDTDAYYFLHDRDNVFHTAETLEEQEANIAEYGVAQ